MDITGLLSFSNFIFTISIVMIVAASCWLFGLYFVPIIAYVPINVIECVLYVVLGLCIHQAHFWHGSLAYIWGLLYACGLTGTTILSAVSHDWNTYTLFNFVNMMIHGVTGVYLQSKMICCVSVLFFMSLIGFNVGFGHGFILFGFHKKDVIASAMISSGLVTLVGCVLKINPSSLGIFSKPALLFVPGMLWFGSYVFYLSLLIMSSKYYANPDTYVFNNMLTIVLGVLALVFGNLYNISQLTGISGTFFVIWLLEKYLDFMPSNNSARALSVLLIGVALYLINMYFRIEFEKSGIEKYFNFAPTFDMSVAQHVVVKND